MRDFGERSADDIYMLYTGGTTGYPKGVLWRHEDVWRTLGGGIDFTTGERLPDEWEQIRRGTAGPGRHGPADHSAAHPRQRAVGHAAWPVLRRHGGVRAAVRPARGLARRAAARVNVLMIIGDAMARPLIEAYQEEEYDVSSLLAISSNAALFSPSVKDQYLDAAAERRHHRRDRRVRDRLHRPRLRVGGQQEGRGARR